MVAYRLFASGHELRLQRPVTLNSFLQKFCVFILHQPPHTPPSSKDWVLCLLRDCQQKQGERKQMNPFLYDLQLAKRLRQNYNRILSSYGTHGHRECKKKMHKKSKKRRMVLVLGFVAAVAMVNDLPDDIVRLHPRLDPLASSLLRLSVPVSLRQ